MLIEKEEREGEPPQVPSVPTRLPGHPPLASQSLRCVQPRVGAPVDEELLLFNVRCVGMSAPKGSSCSQPGLVPGKVFFFFTCRRTLCYLCPFKEGKSLFFFFFPLVLKHSVVLCPISDASHVTGAEYYCSGAKIYAGALGGYGSRRLCWVLSNLQPSPEAGGQDPLHCPSSHL